MANWQQVAAARAQGRDVDPEDVAEVRRAARPPAEGWAKAVADRAVSKRRQPRREGETYESAILERLGMTRPQDDDGPDAA